MNAHPMVLITGASRSGTTMLNRMLGMHSAVLGLNELHCFGDLCQPGDTAVLPERQAQRLAAQLLARQAHGIWEGRPGPQEEMLARQLVETLPPAQRTCAEIFRVAVNLWCRNAGKRIASEHTPRNIFYARELLDIFPDWRVIHLIRDPRAVMASQKNRWRRRQLGGSNIPLRESLRVWINYHPFTICKLWRRATLAALALAQHPRVRILRFEDLIDSPEHQLRGLCEFLGLDFEAGMLDIPQVGSSNAHHNVHERGVSRTVVSAWQKVLSPAEISLCEHVLDAEMNSLRYVHRVGREKVPRPCYAAMCSLYPLHLLSVLLANPRRAYIQARALALPRSKQG